MRILALDTSSKVFCLALGIGQARYEYNLEVSTRLSRLLVPTLERVLKTLCLKPGDFDYFACGIGPGSFTGVRCGMSAAKAMAWACSRPLVGVPSLDALASAVEIEDGFAVPVIDAKRGLLYSCVYQISDRRLRQLTPYLLVSCDDLVRRIRHTVQAPRLAQTWLLGDGLAIHREALCRHLPRLQVADRDHWQLSARHVLDRALESIRGRAASDAFRLKPLYLYPKECQIRHMNPSLWSTRKRK